jgi:hypothetical protein
MMRRFACTQAPKLDWVAINKARAIARSAARKAAEAAIANQTNSKQIVIPQDIVSQGAKELPHKSDDASEYADWIREIQKGNPYS